MLMLGQVKQKHLPTLWLQLVAKVTAVVSLSFLCSADFFQLFKGQAENPIIE